MDKRRIIITIRADSDLLQLGLTKREISNLSPYAQQLMEREGKYTTGFNMIKRIMVTSGSQMSIPLIIRDRRIYYPWFYPPVDMDGRVISSSVVMFNTLTGRASEISVTSHFCNSRNIQYHTQLD